MKIFLVLREIVVDIPSKLNGEYFSSALLLAVVLGVPWFLFRKKIMGQKYRYLCDILIISLIIAPSIFPSDMKS
ncbi:MAG TPA: hypothetical protein VF988_05270, partial [Verrucomicrobiae bacterium]